MINQGADNRYTDGCEFLISCCSVPFGPHDLHISAHVSGWLKKTSISFKVLLCCSTHSDTQWGGQRSRVHDLSGFSKSHHIVSFLECLDIFWVTSYHLSIKLKRWKAIWWITLVDPEELERITAESLDSRRVNKGNRKWNCCVAGDLIACYNKAKRQTKQRRSDFNWN